MRTGHPGTARDIRRVPVCLQQGWSQRRTARTGVGRGAGSSLRLVDCGRGPTAGKTLGRWRCSASSCTRCDD